MLSWIKRSLKGKSHGFSLVEALIAMVILGAISGAFLNGLGTAYKADLLANQKTSAESLVRTEFEYIKDSPYWAYGFSYEIPAPPGTVPPWDADHDALPADYQGYSIEVLGQQINPSTRLTYIGPDMGIQLITIDVYHGNTLMVSSSTYKILR